VPLGSQHLVTFVLVTFVVAKGIGYLLLAS
jgi:hypothetical protein